MVLIMSECKTFFHCHEITVIKVREKTLRIPWFYIAHLNKGVIFFRIICTFPNKIIRVYVFPWQQIVNIWMWWYICFCFSVFVFCLFLFCFSYLLCLFFFFSFFPLSIFIITSILYLISLVLTRLNDDILIIAYRWSDYLEHDHRKFQIENKSIYIITLKLQS
jgi:hypothetical protein